MMEEKREVPIMDEAEAAERVVAETLRSKPVSIVRLASGINGVYEVGTRREGAYIVELHTELGRVKQFYRGAWGMEMARRAGVPAPKVLATGSRAVPYAYVAYKKIPGVSAEEYAGDKIPVWRQLGELARKIHSVSVGGYGRVGYWKPGYRESYDSWEEYVTEELERFANSEFFEPYADLPPELRTKLALRLAELKSWRFNPRLIHGDIALKNTIVDERGRVTGIIDWDEITFGRAPVCELASTLPWAGRDEADAFAEGYGMSEAERAAAVAESRKMELFKDIEIFIWAVGTGDDDARRAARVRIVDNLSGNS